MIDLSRSTYIDGCKGVNAEPTLRTRQVLGASPETTQPEPPTNSEFLVGGGGGVARAKARNRGDLYNRRRPGRQSSPPVTGARIYAHHTPLRIITACRHKEQDVARL